jgi:hypothetical protein
MKRTIRKWTALAVVLVGVLGASAAFSEARGACYEAYLQSGLTAQQVSFDQFHKLYSDTLCTPVGDGLQASHEARVPGEAR